MATSYSAGERTGNSGVNFPSGGGLPLEEELPLSDPEEEDPQEDDDREWEYDPGDNDLPEYSQFDPFSIGNPDEPTGGDTNPNQTRRAPKKKRLKHYLNKRYREFRSSVIHTGDPPSYEKSQRVYLTQVQNPASAITVVVTAATAADPGYLANRQQIADILEHRSEFQQAPQLSVAQRLQKQMPSFAPQIASPLREPVPLDLLRNLLDLQKPSAKPVSSMEPLFIPRGDQFEVFKVPISTKKGGRYVSSSGLSIFCPPESYTDGMNDEAFRNSFTNWLEARNKQRWKESGIYEPNIKTNEWLFKTGNTGVKGFVPLILEETGTYLGGRLKMWRTDRAFQLMRLQRNDLASEMGTLAPKAITLEWWLAIPNRIKAEYHEAVETCFILSQMTNMRDQEQVPEYPDNQPPGYNDSLHSPPRPSGEPRYPTPENPFPSLQEYWKTGDAQQRATILFERGQTPIQDESAAIQPRSGSGGSDQRPPSRGGPRAFLANMMRQANDQRSSY